MRLEPIVYLSYMSSRARPISQKSAFEPFLKSVFSDNKHALQVAAASGGFLFWGGIGWSINGFAMCSAHCYAGLSQIICSYKCLDELNLISLCFF